MDSNSMVYGALRSLALKMMFLADDMHELVIKTQAETDELRWKFDELSDRVRELTAERDALREQVGGETNE